MLGLAVAAQSTCAAQADESCCTCSLFTEVYLVNSRGWFVNIILHALQQHHVHKLTCCSGWSAAAQAHSSAACNGC